MIEVRHLTKRFGAQRSAVEDLSLTIQQGDAMGFIGPNGAGKTTTMRIIATLLPATAGDVFVQGRSVTRFPEETKPLVGYLPDEFGIYRNLRVREFLEFFAAAYRLARGARRQAIADVVELTDLGSMTGTYLEALSRGMRQRVFIAKTLLANPPVLVLDEPAANLDPRARIELKSLLNELKRMGKTIFISSHILPELSDFCNKIAVIEQGRLVVCDEVARIIAMLRPGRHFAIACLGAAGGLTAHLRGRNVELVGPGSRPPLSAPAGVDRAEVVLKDGDEQAADLLAGLVRDGLRIVEFREIPMNLEDVFLKVTEGKVA